LSAIGRYLLLVLGLVGLGAAASRAEDLERGKSGPAIFAADCSGCHRSAQGLAYGMSATELMNLLRQHYTTGPGPANQVATYLLSVVGSGRRPKEKPLTEPQSTAAGAAGEQAGKRRARGEEGAADPAAGPRPPADVGGQETAIGEQSGVGTDRGQPGPASKRRQHANQPAESALPSRSKKLGQPTTATRAPDTEPTRPPESVPAQPPESVAVRGSEPAAAARQSGEIKPAETAPRPESGTKAETAVEIGQARAPAPPEAAKPSPRQENNDQPAFSAPSP
jgi:hypothetical protein